MEAKIERLDSTNSAVIHTTSSRETEIRDLKEELQVIREKVKEAKATLAMQKPRLWHR